MVLKKNSEDNEAKSFLDIPPISVKNEIKILLEITKLCEEALASYETDLNSDLQLLTDITNGKKVITSNNKNCLLMRIGEKIVIKHFNLGCEILFRIFYLQ